MYVLELGVEETVDKHTKKWVSHGFYAGYGFSGPNIVAHPSLIPADYKWPTKEPARYLAAGDDRMKSSRVIEEHEIPPMLVKE